MKPWRKRHAGRAFTSDAPMPFKKQRTGFVGGASAEMAARTRHIMKYANPQLSAVLEAVAPAASTGSPIPVAPPLSATGTGAPVPVAPPLSADIDAKAPASASPLDSADSPGSLLQRVSDQTGRPIDELKANAAMTKLINKHDELRKERDAGSITSDEYSTRLRAAYNEFKKQTASVSLDSTDALMQSIKAGKTLKKVDQKEKKAAPTDPQDAINQAIKAGGKLKKVDAAAHAAAKKAAEEKEKAEKPTVLDELNKGTTLKKADLKTQEAIHQVAAYQDNKTPKQEEKLRAWSHKLGEAIAELDAHIKKEEDLHGKSDETNAIRKKKNRLVARKKIIDEGLK